MATLERTESIDLTTAIPGAVTRDTRPNYEGWIVEGSRLTEVATYVRDRLGFDLLSSVTGVDYFPDTMEVVYHVYRTVGGPGVIFKVQVPRQDPVEVPS